MTDEQIKQNAEEYFNNDFAKRLPSEVRNEELIKEAYIIGAHSRDEEVNLLNKEANMLLAAYKKLRNPWISVEDDTPKISTKKGSFSSEPVFVRIVSEDGIVYHGIGTYYVRDKSWCIRNERDSVTHWMPIQQIEKGE